MMHQGLVWFLGGLKLSKKSFHMMVIYRKQVINIKTKTISS